MSNDCPKCKAILEYIQQQKNNPPAISFEVEGPVRDIFKNITEIITRKSPLEKLYDQAKKTRNLKRLLKERKRQEL